MADAEKYTQRAFINGHISVNIARNIDIIPDDSVGELDNLGPSPISIILTGEIL
ncbi:MAG: hypothetical protein LUQ62_03505 [Methanomicrobiales archaeon]|nr:hypothetical protein [Methanomicrobiales archaeon]